LGGIFALVGYGSERSSDLIRKMCWALRHRGSDNSESFVDSDVALGCVEFLKEPAKFVQQPLSNTEGSIWIILDGEIYNADEMRKQVGDGFTTSSDAEVILRVYEKYGVDCVRRLDGFFCFCIWDSVKKQLLVARDRFGLKPLWYFKNADKCIFAPEIKAIFADETVPRLPNHTKICKYLTAGYYYRDGDTYFDQIKELLPGHYITWNLKENRFDLHEYWHIIPSSSFEKSNDYSSRLSSLFRNAVEKRLPKDIPFATCLSGGVDSQTLASTIDSLLGATNLGKNILVSIVFEGVSHNENEEPYVREFERFRNRKVHYVRVPFSIKLADIKELVYYLEEPLHLMSMYIPLIMAKELRKLNVKVAFSGTFSDVLFWGSDIDQVNYLKSLWRKKEMGTLLVEFMAMIVKRDYSYKPLSLLRDGINEFVVSKVAPLNIKFVNQRYALKYSSETKESMIDKVLGEIVETNNFADRLYSSFQVEHRYVFLDVALHDYVNNLPPNQKIRRGVRKYIWRKIAKGQVPESVRKSVKKFASPVPSISWLKGLKRDIFELVTSETFVKREIFDETKVLEAVKKLFEGSLNSAQTRKIASAIWRIVILELWFRTYIDN
jgi:asparagine synthase (glutamine-hydrolysing)